MTYDTLNPIPDWRVLQDRIDELEARLEGHRGTVDVLDDGFVRLDRHSGTDLDIVNHARISLSVQKDVLDDTDEGLIRYLMDNRHGTPFESIFFSFHVRAPIFVARQWMRHRIAGYNEISGRYTKFEPKFYTPAREDIRTQIGKQSQYRYEELADQDGIEATFGNIFDQCMATYNYLLSRGVAKELARIVLPPALYTEFYFDVNARSLMNFIAQRNHPHAQLEMREYAKEIEAFFAAVAPICYNSFIENGRTAP